MAEELRDGGFIVAEASGADDAIAVLKSTEEIGLVLTDIRMPGTFDGIALAEWVRRERALKIRVWSWPSQWRGSLLSSGPACENPALRARIDLGHHVVVQYPLDGRRAVAGSALVKVPALIQIGRIDFIGG